MMGNKDKNEKKKKQESNKMSLFDKSVSKVKFPSHLNAVRRVTEWSLIKNKAKPFPS